MTPAGLISLTVLVGDSAEAKPSQVQLAYYKDLLPLGGQLKPGYGPGGTPVLKVSQLRALLRQVDELSGESEQLGYTGGPPETRV